jgi:hypothetical protein
MHVLRVWLTNRTADHRTAELKREHHLFNVQSCWKQLKLWKRCWKDFESNDVLPNDKLSCERHLLGRWRPWDNFFTDVTYLFLLNLWRHFLKSTVFLEIRKTCWKCMLHILQLLCKYFTLLFFTLCLHVAMTHYLDLWHLKTVKTAIFIT